MKNTINNENSPGSISTIDQNGGNIIDKKTLEKGSLHPKKTNLWSKTNWLRWAIGIILTLSAIIVPLIWNQNKNMPKENIINSTNSPGSINTIGQTGGTNNVYNSDNTPAIFSENHTILPLENGQYQATIKITANKGNNLPAQLCVVLKTDASIIPRRGLVIRNDGVQTAQMSIGGNYQCLVNPSKNITSYFLLDRNPTIFEINFTTTIPGN